MRPRVRYFAVVSVLSILIAIFVVYQASSGLGFPDGHLTPLDRALKLLAHQFIGVSALTALWCAYLGVTGAQPRAEKLWRVTWVGYALFVLVMSGVVGYALFVLQDGRGG